MKNEEVVDYYKNHKFHGAFMKNCSECFKENRLIRAKVIVDRGILSSRTTYSNPDYEWYNNHPTAE